MPRRARAPLPLATVGLVVAILATYAVERAGDGLGLCGAYGLVPARPSALSALTSLFLHDPDPKGWSHVVGNAAMLLVAGTAVERVLGHARLLTLFVVCGVAGGMMHVAADPTSTAPLVGASAAVYGLLAAMAMLFPRAAGFVGALAAFNVAQTLMGSGGSVAVAAHCAGFAAGFALMATAFLGRLAAFRGWMARGAAAR